MNEMKKEYYRQYYKSDKTKQANANHDYWYRKAQEKYNTDEPTEEQIKETRNEYYRQYRKNNPEIIKKNQNDFFERYAKNKVN